MVIRIKKKGNCKARNDWVCSLCVAAYYIIQVIFALNLSCFGRNPLIERLFGIIYRVLLVICIYEVLKRRKKIKLFLGFELIFLIAFLSSYTMNTALAEDLYSKYITIAASYIPIAMVICSVSEKKKLMQVLGYSALFVAPVAILSIVITYGNWLTEYDMSLGYILAFTALILFADYSLSHKWLDLVFAIILGFLILFIGSRGPIITIFVFLGLTLVFFSHQLSPRKMIFLMVIVVVLIVCLIFYKELIDMVIRMAETLGFNSRSLALLAEGNFVTHDSGRNRIHKYYNALIKDNPIIGYGVMGHWIAIGDYPHNIVLEWMMAFGIPIALVLLALFFGMIVTSIKTKNEYDNVIARIFISYCALLFVSNSFLNVWQFFVCAAVCFDLSKTHINRKLYKKLSLANIRSYKQNRINLN